MKNKRKGTIKIFKFLLIGIIGISILGCNPDNPEPNGSVIIKWNMTLDGQNYSWQDTYPESSTSATGSSQFTLQSNGVGQFILSNSQSMNGLTISITKSAMNNAGSYSFNQTNYTTNSSFSIINSANGTIQNNSFGGSVVLNITVFPTNSVSVNGVSTSSLVKGSFSGTIGKSAGGTSTLSGSFESIRTQ
jgi:hypothetical protein